MYHMIPKKRKKTLLISIWGVYPESERGQDAKTRAWSLTTNSFNCFKPWLRRGLEKVTPVPFKTSKGNAGLKNVSSPSKTASWLTVHPGSIMIHQHQLGLCQETQGLSSIRWMQERSLCVWHQVIETCPLLPCRPTKKVSWVDVAHKSLWPDTLEFSADFWGKFDFGQVKKSVFTPTDHWFELPRPNNQDSAICTKVSSVCPFPPQTLVHESVQKVAKTELPQTTSSHSTRAGLTQDIFCEELLLLVVAATRWASTLDSTDCWVFVHQNKVICHQLMAVMRKWWSNIKIMGWSSHDLSHTLSTQWFSLHVRNRPWHAVQSRTLDVWDMDGPRPVRVSRCVSLWRTP